MNIRRTMFGIFLLVIAAGTVPAQVKKQLTAEQIFSGKTPEFTAPLPRITGWDDDATYIEMKKKEGDERPVPYLIDARTGEDKGRAPEVNLDEFKDLLGEGITPSRPSDASKDRSVVIYAKDNDLYLFTPASKTLTRLTNDAAEEKNPTLSPSAEFVAFTRDNDLYSVDLKTGKETRYTTDGSDLVYSGWASWVYYEEILGRRSRYQAFWWAPDSRRIAFFRFDDSPVPMFPIYNSEGQHGFLERTRYPKAGDQNPYVRVGVVPVTGGTIAWASFDEKADQYFGPPYWMPDGKTFLVQWMNRGQDNLKIYAMNPTTGRTVEIYDEKQSSWIDWYEDMPFLSMKGGFLLNSDKDGWNHLYYHGNDGKLIARLTSGPWRVRSVEVVDEDNGMVYFTASREASTRTDLYSVRLDGSDMKRLTFGQYTHRVQVSPKGSYFITTYSNVSTPPRMALCDKSGAVVRELGDSKTKELDAYALATTELIRIPTEDGYQLPALVTLPLNLDPAKKYPVLISIYGGPNAGTVSDGWRMSMNSQWMAMEGLIQVSVDHRGSGHFGKEGVALMHRNLGKWEMHDYIEAVKWLLQKPYVDKNKICITGGSYGGYVTAMALTYGSDYFTHGISSSPVIDWKLYDSHYTERYMDTPAENPEGYAFGSAVTHADKYKGLLRIVHGTMDDNVHMQNTIQLVDTLENLNRHFEFMLYPGERHGWGPPKSNHTRSETARFIYTHLLEKPFPEELYRNARMGR